MTIPFTDDENSSEKESCIEDEGHESEDNGLKFDTKTKFKDDISLNLEETTQYHNKPYNTCFESMDYRYLEIFLKLITWLMLVIITLKNSSRCFCKEFKVDHWYRKVRKKCQFEYVKDKNSKLNEWILNTIVKPLRHIPRYIYTAYPFFPDKYDSFVKDDKLKQKLDIMKFEAARLSTFSTFPSSAEVFAIRLASAGFYYSGQGDEVICFSCGIKYGNWQKQDSPMDIHRKMSALCSFVLNSIKEDNKDTDNIPDLVHQSTGACDRHDLVHQVTGACGNTSDMIHTNTNQCHNEKESSNRFDNLYTPQNTNITSHSGAVLTSSTYTNQSNNTLISRSSNDVNSLIRIPNSNIYSNQSAYSHIETTNETLNPNEAFGMGVCTDKPKYPKFAIRSVRLDSFNTWPRHITQSPEELACAGFFFTGIEDHCRCFYCGGGLKHWEPEDQPWIEHARWYQHCPFVKQNKGDKFIDDVKSGRQIQNIPTSQSEENNQQTITRTSNSTQNDFLNHPAVQLVSEFGYDSSTMQAAYNSLVQSGSTDITATSLLERIFMQEETTNGNQRKGTGQQSTTQLSHTNEPIKSNSHMVPANDPELGLSIQSLEEENQNLRDQQTCKICLDEPVAIVFLPCGHMAACINCAPALRRCPICRAFIKGTVKAIMC